MILRDLSALKRRDVVRLMLGVVLQDLEQPASTREVADAVGRRLESAEGSLIGRTVVALAPEFPEAQRSENVTFKRFGQSMKPWVWSPRRPPVNQSPSARGDTPLRNETTPLRNEDGADDMWTVYPTTPGR